MPFQDRADADRFFARIKSLDLECPACGTVYCCTGQSGPFSRLTGRFKCHVCKKVLALAVLAYEVTTDTRHEQQPDDWTPTPREAQALRNQNPGLLARLGKRRSPVGPRNVVLREACRCQLKGTALIVHPGCPVHSVGGITGGS